jgi:hypothetical protein
MGAIFANLGRGARKAAHNVGLDVPNAPGTAAPSQLQSLVGKPPPPADFTDEALVKRALLQRKQSARATGVSGTFLTGESATGAKPPKAGGGY